MNSESTPSEAGTEPPAISDAEPPAVALPPRKLRLVLAVGLIVLVLDQLTKTWAVNALADGPIDVFWTLKFNLHFNPGVSFSLGSDSGIGPWISVLGIGVVIAVALGTTSRFALGAVAAGMISGGALGNVADRALRGDRGFLHGEVVDFIDFGWWPVFNVADIGVVVGAFLLVIASLKVPA